MPNQDLSSIYHTDICLVDQKLKGLYNNGGKLLDAGCGSGRNLSWFVLQPNIDVFATDISNDAVTYLAQSFPSLRQEQLICAPAQQLPFSDAFFDHIICSAVLHFAESEADFFHMFSGLNRVLKPGGSLFIRMASDIGLETFVQPLGDGRFFLPDGSNRFLLTRVLIKQLTERYPMTFIEPVKTTNVQDIRCMTTLVMLKK
ncbi:MAG: class I SAM-dependent methyltransferase [Bacteroidota bacterium]